MKEGIEALFTASQWHAIGQIVFLIVLLAVVARFIKDFILDD